MRWKLCEIILRYNNLLIFRMERKISPSLNQQNKNNIKSSFISQYTAENKQKTNIHLTSRKQLSSSTFLDLEESKQKFATNRKISRKQSEYVPLAEELTRARSLKNIEEIKFKSMQIIEKNQLNNLNENTLKLKSEELLFKLKVKFGTLLQEVNITEAELNKFNKIHKVDEIILFLSEKIKDKLNQFTHIRNESNITSNKDRQGLEKSQLEVENLKNKLIEKENAEKNYRSKLKESHTELKQLYDKINVKEKEYSQRMTEIYQLKMQMKEHEKVVDTLKNKITNVEKEKAEMKNLISNDSKDHSELLKTFKQEKEDLTFEINEIREELERYRQKDSKMQELNLHLNEQLTRWRERFEFEGDEKESEQKEKSSEEAPNTPNDIMMGSLPNELKKSTMSMNNSYINNFNNSIRVQSLTSLEIQNTKLKLQVKELAKENEQLQRNLLNYSTFKEKYEQTLDFVGEKEVDLSKGIDNKKLEYLKGRSGDLYRTEIEGHYKRKIEQVAKEWKQKLYEIVCKYEDDIQLLKKDIFNLTHDKQISEKKIFSLANEKYEAQTRLIELQKDLYSISQKPSRSIISIAHSDEHQSYDKESEIKSQDKSSEEMIASSPHLELKPIQEQESPLKKQEESRSENKPLFINYRESFGVNE